MYTDKKYVLFLQVWQDKFDTSTVVYRLEIRNHTLPIAGVEVNIRLFISGYWAKLSLDLV